MKPLRGNKINKNVIPESVAIPNCCHKRTASINICNGAVSVGLVSSEQKMRSGPKHRPSLQKGFQITSGCLEDSRNHNLKEFKLLYFKQIK
jgi:hypothetical protein